MSALGPGAPEDLPPRYRLDAELGRGGMGAVYAATDLELNRPVAIKVLAIQASAEVLERFRREARALSALEHPNIVRVYDHGASASGPYLVMEHVAGRSLYPPPQGLDALGTMLAIGDALEAIHAAGLVHRDLKPANIMLTDDGRPVLLDFGLVHDPGRTHLTATGAILGTPMYMSPEQLRGAWASPTDDWWSWAACLFHLHEGRAPFSASDLRAMMAGQPPPPLSMARAAPSSPLGHFYTRALGTFPEERPTSLSEVREVLGLTPYPAETTRERRSLASAAPAAGDASAAHPRVTGSEPAPRPGWTLRHTLAVGLVLGSLAVGLGLGPWGGAGPAAGPLEPSGGPDLAARVEAARAALDDLWPCDLGEPPPRVVGPCRSRDPIDWGDTLASEGAIAALDAALAGAHAADLPDAVLTRLAGMDADLAARGWPRIYAPIQRAARAESAGPLGEEARQALGSLAVPDPAPESLRRAAQAFDEVRAEFHRLPREPFLNDVSRNTLVGLVGPSRDLDPNLRVGYGYREYRLRTLPLLTRSQEAMRWFLACAGRLARDPAAAELAVPLVARVRKSYLGLFFGPMAYEPAARLVGPPSPPGPAAELHALVVKMQRLVQTSALGGADDEASALPALRAAEHAAWWAAMGDDATTPAARDRRGRALRELVELDLEERAYARLAQDAARGWPFIEGLPLGSLRASLVGMLARGFSRPDCPLPEGDLADRVLRNLRALEAAGFGVGEWASPEVRARLRARLDEGR